MFCTCRCSSCVLQGRCHLSSGEQLLRWCLQVSQVPGDPEDQAEEDQDWPWENQEVPEAQGCKDSDEEKDQANSIQEDSDEVEPQTSAQVSSAIHDKQAVGCAFYPEKIIHSFGSFVSLARWKCEGAQQIERKHFYFPSSVLPDSLKRDLMEWV